MFMVAPIGSINRVTRLSKPLLISRFLVVTGKVAELDKRTKIIERQQKMKRKFTNKTLIFFFKRITTAKTEKLIEMFYDG